MKVVAAVNGMLTAEAAAMYALAYAKANGFSLVLFHVRNPSDAMSDVRHSIEGIREIAEAEGVEVEEEIYDLGGVGALVGYIHANHIDTVFCSTRARRRFLSASFSDRLVKAAPKVDIAVVRVVHVNTAMRPESVILPIKETRLSVQKFTFFSTMLKAYEAEGTILSINTMGRRNLARFTIHRTKQFFKGLNRRLGHYTKLTDLMSLRVRLKHVLGESERHELLNYLGSGEYDLMVIGGQRLSFFSKVLGERPIEQILRETSVNTIAYYAKEDM